MRYKNLPTHHLTRALLALAALAFLQLVAMHHLDHRAARLAARMATRR